jgi:hypothetical protein
MECETMTELKFGEQAARRMGKASGDNHLQMLYVQWALDAQRVQTIHFEGCRECQGRAPQS